MEKLYFDTKKAFRYRIPKGLISLNKFNLSLYNYCKISYTLFIVLINKAFELFNFGCELSHLLLGIATTLKSLYKVW